MTTELDLRKTICDVGRRMYARNLAAATDGNISVRLGADRYLCTPSGVSKGFMQPNDLVIADAQGRKLAGDGRVTSEFFTHLAAYEERPDVQAVVHAHPPKAIGFTLAGVSLADCVLPEVVYAIGGIPTTEYATPASKEGAKAVRKYIGQCDALMLDRHGALTVGKDLLDAYFKMEKIEHAAESLLTAHALGNVQILSSKQVQKLYDVGEAYGITGRRFQCGACTCPAVQAQEAPGGHEELDQTVAETIRILGRS